MYTFVIVCVAAIVLLVGLIIFGVVSAGKKKKGDQPAYHVAQDYDEVLAQPILRTPEKEGFLFSGTRETAQDRLIRAQYGPGTPVRLTDPADGGEKTYTVEKIRRHYEPSLKVSGDCWVYMIYFREFEGVELPKTFSVNGSDVCDALTFTDGALVLQKDGAEIRSLSYETLRGKYLNDYLEFRVQEGDSAKAALWINPGKGGALDRKVSPEKVFLEPADFEAAKRLTWKYVNCEK